MNIRKPFDSPLSDIEDETVELRRQRDSGEPPSPITFIPVRRQSHLPSISEIHHLRLSLNEKLMNANNPHNSSSTSSPVRRASRSTPFVTAPSSPVSLPATRKLATILVENKNKSESSPTVPNNKNDEDLQMLLIRDHHKTQKSFVHSNHESEMRRVLELREVNQRMISDQNSKELDTNSNAFFKRNSFLRNSWNVILRQSMRLSGGSGSSPRSSWEGGNGEGVKRREKTTAGSGSEKNNGTSDSEFFANRFSFQSLRRKKGKNSSAAANSATTVTNGRGHKRNSSTSSFFSNR